MIELYRYVGNEEPDERLAEHFWYVESLELPEYHCLFDITESRFGDRSQHILLEHETGWIKREREETDEVEVVVVTASSAEFAQWFAEFVGPAIDRVIEIVDPVCLAAPKWIMVPDADPREGVKRRS